MKNASELCVQRELSRVISRILIRNCCTIHAMFAVLQKTNRKMWIFHILTGQYNTLGIRGPISKNTFHSAYNIADTQFHTTYSRVVAAKIEIVPFSLEKLTRQEKICFKHHRWDIMQELKLLFLTERFVFV